MGLRFPEGILTVRSEKPSVLTSATPQEASKITEKSNTPEFLKNAFFSLDDPFVLSVQELQNEGAVSVVIPTGPYSETDLLVVAAGPTTFSQEKSQTESIYDYPESVQTTYWKTILTVLDSLEMQKKPGQIAVMTENAISEVSHSDKRTSRTIMLPHAHVFLFSPEEVQSSPLPQEWTHLHTEQRALNMWLQSPKFSAFETELTEALKVLPASVSAKTDLPKGYEIRFSDDATPEEVALAMNINQRIYHKTADKMIRDLKVHTVQKLIPQASYRLYLHHDTEANQYVFTVSPEFISHAGVLEAAGVVLERKLNAPEKASPEEKTRIRQIVLSALQAQV